MIVWRLRKGADRRVRAGHPWVYSNELAESPKGIAPGEPVELRDAGGGFVARGFGNPSSLIAFRVVSRDPGELEPLSAGGLAIRVSAAAEVRARLGLLGVSHRLIFGEADGLPGLIVDRYALEGGVQAFVVAAHSAGADRLAGALVDALDRLAPGAAVVLRNDVAVRKLEGLEPAPPAVLRAPPGFDPDAAVIRVARASGGAPLALAAPLLAGQKTGFFLDQAANVALASRLCASAWPEGAEVRILDLCCYVGQWGVQLGAALLAHGRRPHVTFADASARALELAEGNARRAGVPAAILRADVLRDLGDLPAAEFDLVVSDPPAFIQRKKDVPQGAHAYLQLGTQALRLARPGGAVVACSCSALLEEEVFAATLAKAARRAGRPARWIARGTQAPDHPVLLEFPEGRYLKCWIGLV